MSAVDVDTAVAVDTVVWLDRHIGQFQMADTVSCLNAIDYAQRSERWRPSETVTGVNTKARDSNILDFSVRHYPPEHKPILEFAQACLDIYLMERPRANETVHFAIQEDYAIHRYSPGQGYHALHSDWGPVFPMDRRHLTFLLYLNTLEVGGETEFPEQDVLVRPLEGRAIIFPTVWTHSHRSLPASEDRWVVNAWWSLQNGPG